MQSALLFFEDQVQLLEDFQNKTDRRHFEADLRLACRVHEYTDSSRVYFKDEWCSGCGAFLLWGKACCTGCPLKETSKGRKVATGDESRAVNPYQSYGLCFSCFGKMIGNEVSNYLNIRVFYLLCLLTLFLIIFYHIIG